jgi:pimeloyl-ACP methyl ester carboxylesterase
MAGRNIIRALVLIAAALLAAGCISRVLYQPSREVRHTPSDIRLDYEDVRFAAEDGVELSGWWVPSAQPRGTVLFCHGNGGNISACLDSLLIIHRLGLNAFLFDYRGYGLSRGSPTEEGTYLDAEAAWNELVARRKIAPESIVIWGRSLGGAIAARTAAKHRAGILICESAFTSLQDLVRDRIGWVPSWAMGGYSYDTRAFLEKVDVPVLVIHSPDDEMIPYRHGKTLYDSIRGPKAFAVIRGSHNQGFIESETAYTSSIDDFIRKNLTSTGEATHGE